MAGYHVRKGTYGDTPLDDIDLVMAASWPGAIHQGNGTVRLHIDESTSEAQRDAILMIFSGEAKGNGPFELFSSTFSTVETPVFTTVEVHVDGRNSWFRVPGMNRCPTRTVHEPRVRRGAGHPGPHAGRLHLQEGTRGEDARDETARHGASELRPYRAKRIFRRSGVARDRNRAEFPGHWIQSPQTRVRENVIERRKLWT